MEPLTGEPVDEDTSRAWAETAIEARMVAHQLAHLGDPAPASAVGWDDLLYPSERLSAWTSAYLRAAVDHLTLWADTVAPRVVHDAMTVTTPPRPYYALARAALESAAQGAWILMPTERPTRVERHVRLLYSNFDEQVRGTRLRNAVAADNATRRRDAIAERYTAGDVKPAPAYLDLVRATAIHAGLTADEAEVVWRTASAAAHGKRWFLDATHTMTVGEEYSPGYFRTQMQPDPAGVTEAMRAAVNLTTWGVLRLADGYGRDLQALIADASEYVAATQPKKAPAQ